MRVEYQDIHMNRGGRSTAVWGRGQLGNNRENIVFLKKINQILAILGGHGPLPPPLCVHQCT